MNFYINRDGKYIHADGVEFHTQLAEMILDRSPYLKRLFEKSGKSYPDDFMLENLGYIKVRNYEYAEECTFYGRIMNEQQLLILERFAANGYRLIDITPTVIEKSKLAKQEQKSEEDKGEKDG